MSMDFRKTTYRPTRMDNRFRTSYALMSQWMNRKGSSKAYIKDPIPQTFAIAMQGNAAFPKRPVFSADERQFDVSRSLGQFEGHGSHGAYLYPSDPMLSNVTAQQAAIDGNVPVHLRFSDGAGYDDFHKAYQQIGKQWPTVNYPDFGPPRLRHGRAGGSWRHVKEVLQAGGSRIVFVDGVIRWTDGMKIDEIPGGHLIQPKIEDIKSRYILPNNQDLAGSGDKRNRVRPVSKSAFLALNEFHGERPTIWRSATDLPDFIAYGKSGL